MFIKNLKNKIELLFVLLLFIHSTKQQQTEQENTNLTSGIILTLKNLPNENQTNLFYYINETNNYEGVYFKNNKQTELKNEIKFYLDNITKKKYLNLIDNNKINGSFERVKLIRSISNYFNLTETSLKLNSIDYYYYIYNSTDNTTTTTYSNKTLIISLTNINESLINNNDLCQEFIKNLENKFEKKENQTIKLLNERIYEIELNGFCGEKNNKMLKFKFLTNNSTIELDDLVDKKEDNLLISAIIPLSIISGMLIIAIILACILHKLNKKDEKEAKLRDKNPIYKQKSYLSKGVPVILYEEMTEKSIEEEDTLSGGHRMPLIMRNEKPPQPAPPEYRKKLSLENLDDEQTINDIKNMLNNAPLASSEQIQINDDTYPFLITTNSNNNNNKDDLLFYQPPQPIPQPKDMPRRPHTNTSQNQTTQFLP